jgi:Cu2+-exporting ATPase
MEHEHKCQAHGENPVMCSCSHNPGGECHCPPNECKCDQEHHLSGRTQVGHACCQTGAPHDHDVHSGHAGHEGHEGHEGHSGHEGHEGHSSHEGHTGHDHSHHDPKIFQRQFWFSLILTIPTVLYSTGFQELLHFAMPVFPFSQYLPAALGLVLLFTGGRVFLKSGLTELRSRKPGMMSLISLALVVAFGYSTFLTIAQLLNLGFAGMDFWWEGAALVTIMLLGHWIEMSSVMKAQNAVGELAQLIPDTAELVVEGIASRVPVSSLKVGDVVLVRPGGNFPADGVVESGKSKVNQAMLTGESDVVAKEPGSQVFGGTLNAFAPRGSIAELLNDDSHDGHDRQILGALEVRLTAVGDSSVISNIMRLVAQAQASKSQTQRLADRAAGWLFYAALGSAALTAIFWSLAGHASPNFVLERVVTVLVIACPHALGLAIPLVTAITTDLAARNGVLIRNRIAFESTRKIDIFWFDKTGTLTTGERGFVSAHITRRGGLEDIDELIAVAAGLEVGSEHSLATAIVAEAAKRGIEPVEVKDVMTNPGIGVNGRVGEFRVFAGGPALLTKQKIDIDVQDLVVADAANTAGYTVVYVVRDTLLLGFVAIGDVMRPTSAQAVAQLQAMGKTVAILSGDAHGVVNAVAKELGINDVYAEVLPHQKAEVVSGLQAKGNTVAMIGDGINDAPALSQADVGIAIGTGTAVAVESADIVLVSDDPVSVAKAVSLAKRSYTKMVQNLWWGAGYNLVAIPLAAGVLNSLGFVLSPAVGAVLMSLSTIIVAANAQLLRRQR